MPTIDRTGVAEFETAPSQIGLLQASTIAQLLVP